MESFVVDTKTNSNAWISIERKAQLNQMFIFPKNLILEIKIEFLALVRCLSFISK